MEISKIKIKIGNHEFEAEGPAEVVKEQFSVFKQLIESQPRQLDPTGNSTIAQTHVNQLDKPQSINSMLERIMHVSGRVVSLTALPTSTEDAALLILLGHKDLKNNVSVTGQEIGDGLAQSGRPVPRVDRIMEKALTDAMVLKSGIKRSTRYRLTNQGAVRAMQIANDLITTLP